jgi:hypothetical protein
MTAFTWAFSQEQQVEEKIEEHYDEMTESWLFVSEELKSYEGLQRFCTNKEFRYSTIDLIKEIHHYDSLIFSLITELSLYNEISDKDYKTMLKSLEKFEGKYTIKDFIDHLRDSCLERVEIEKNQDELEKDYANESYDGRRLVLMTDIEKYLNHIDKRILDIDEHLHLINLDHLKEMHEQY